MLILSLSLVSYRLGCLDSLEARAQFIRKIKVARVTRNDQSMIKHIVEGPKGVIISHVASILYHIRQ